MIALNCAALASSTYARARLALGEILVPVLKWPFRPGKRSDSNQVKSCKRCNKYGGADAVIPLIARQAVSSPTHTSGESIAFSLPQSWPKLWWLNLLCFAITLLSTTVFGFALASAFRRGQTFTEEDWLLGYQLMFHGSGLVWSGLVYSIPVILILLAHEMGHYVLCRRWQIEATLPFFGPSPTLLGTVGAFIWIRSPIYRRRSLFDVGIWGPIAGFVALIPFLVAGIWKSKVIVGVQTHGIFTFGSPLLFRFLEAIRFPGVSSTDICLHPMAVAAWAGLIATAINLLPVGQLDGGHIVYALWGERGHWLTSRLIIVAMALAGFLYWPWWIWALAMLLFRRHPLVYDVDALGPTRRWLSLLAILLLIMSISLVPVRAG